MQEGGRPPAYHGIEVCLAPSAHQHEGACSAIGLGHAAGLREMVIERPATTIHDEAGLRRVMRVGAWPSGTARLYRRRNQERQPPGSRKRIEITL